MKKVKVADLKPWDENPRDITKERFQLLLKQLRYGEIENLVILEDGTVLNGNRRLDAYQIVGRDEATCATVTFEEQEDGTFHMFTDGELCVHHYPESFKGTPVAFDSIKQAMVEIMSVGNSHVGTFNDVKLAELLTDVQPEPQLIEVNLKRGVMAEDLIAAFGPSLPDQSDDSEAIEEKNPVRELKFYLKESDYGFIRATIKKAKKELGLENPNEIVLEAFIAMEDRMDGINYNG